MRVLVIGATGAIGRRIVPQLFERGHEVTGSSRSPARADALRRLGAEPVTVDLLDPASVHAAVAASRPDAIVHQGTALAGLTSFRGFDRMFEQTNRLRTEGTDVLLTAAREFGVQRFVAQSFTSWPYAREGGPVKTEDDRLDPHPPRGSRKTLAAIRHQEQVVTAYGGVALRYGGFYGSPDDAQLDIVCKRRLPIVGDGAGIWSFIHLDDAAAATILAMEAGVAGVLNVVDDDPAPVHEWLPALAKAVGAPPPRHVPRWLARIVAGETATLMMTVNRGASNTKAKRELGWTLRHPSWRQGFVDAYAPRTAEQPARRPERGARTVRA